jgi:hypothetical protein
VLAEKKSERVSTVLPVGVRKERESVPPAVVSTIWMGSSWLNCLYSLRVKRWSVPPFVLRTAV